MLSMLCAMNPVAFCDGEEFFWNLFGMGMGGICDTPLLFECVYVCHAV